MKKIVLLLALISGSVMAKPETVVFPQLYNMGSSVQVNIYNTNDQYITCSGFIFMSTQNGFRDSEYYFDYVAPHFTSFKQIYVRRGDDRIVSISNSVYCN